MSPGCAEGLRNWGLDLDEILAFQLPPQVIRQRLFEPANGLIDLHGRSTAYDHRNNCRVSEGELECRCAEISIKGVAHQAQPLDSLDNFIRSVTIIELDRKSVV